MSVVCHTAVGELAISGITPFQLLNATVCSCPGTPHCACTYVEVFNCVTVSAVQLKLYLKLVAVMRDSTRVGANVRSYCSLGL